MPADANIFQQYLQAPKSVLDYQNEYAKADQLRNTNAIQALTLQQQTAATAQSLAERNALQRIAATSGGDRQALISGMRNSGLPGLMTQADSLEQSGAKLQESQATAAEKNATAGKTTQETQLAGHAQHLQALSTVNTPQDAVQWITDGVRTGALPAAGLQQALDRLQQASASPEQFSQWKQQTQAAGLTVQQQMEQTTAKPTEVRLGNVVKTIDMNPRSPTFGKEVVQQQAIGVSPDTAANNATSIRTTGMNNSTAMRGQDMTDKRFRELNAVAGSTPETEQQLNYWSDVIRKGGALPPGLARGPGGSAFVREVTKRAALGGTTPDEMMANQAEFVGAKAGQRTLGTKQANIEMAATEAYNMIPIAVAASNKVDRTQYPVLNKVLQAAEKGTGDTNVVQLSVAVNSLVNSYSRAISPSGTPTVSDKEHAREILDKAYSKGQFAAAVDLMKQEIDQARKSPSQVRASLRPGAQPATATTDSSTVPPDIANILKKHGGK